MTDLFNKVRHAGQLGSWSFALFLLCFVQPAISDNSLSEYEIKAAFLYNFITFASWPTGTGNVINLCICGENPFGKTLDALQGKTMGDRHIAVQYKDGRDDLGGCQAVFIARPVADNKTQVLEKLRGKPVLTIADTPGAAQLGVVINMNTEANRVTFEVNLAAIRGSGLKLSSKLLRLATEVTQ